MTERELWRAARVPDPSSLSPIVSTREAVFSKIDRLRDQLTESDLIWRSEVRKTLTELRALVATALPPEPKGRACPYCPTVRFTSLRAMKHHLWLVHDEGSRPE